MRLILVLLVLPCMVFSSDDREWNSFKNNNKKSFATLSEENKRFNIWKTRRDEVNLHNERQAKGLETYTKAIYEFSHFTETELQAMLTGAKIPNSKRMILPLAKQAVTTTKKLTTAQKVTTTKKLTTTQKVTTTLPLPKAVDWRNKTGTVPSVKNQGSCGSCWAFATVASIEGQLFLKKGISLRLSEQNLVDCVYGTTGGCNGGWMPTAYNYIKDNNGIDTEASYPYTSGGNTFGTCKFATLGTAAVGAKLSGYVSVAKTEAALQNAVANIGPIAVAILVTNNFYSYKSGVFYDSICASSTLSVNHAVTVVGYGTDASGADYWIVRNSWGSSWGSNGYILMARNKNNNCFIATYGFYPLII